MSKMPDLLIQDLFNKALRYPKLERPSLDRLYIVSGYASAAMGFHHLKTLQEEHQDLAIELVYGMAKLDGIPKSEHKAFLSLSTKVFPQLFKCLYLKDGEPVHSKVYIWTEKGRPVRAFSGSANYTQTAFLKSNRREVLSECDPVRAFDYFGGIVRNAIDCTSSDVTKLFRTPVAPIRTSERDIAPGTASPGGVFVTDPTSEFYGLEKVTLSLLSGRTNETPIHSGLNWGQRSGRDHDQAYLAVNGALRKAGFFPASPMHFTVLTDDNEILECRRAQQSDKGIHTYENNAILGKYFRKRLGLSSGEYVTLKHLTDYGRTDVDFYKIDDENFYLDFSVK